MTSKEAIEVEHYMRIEADRLLARDPGEFVEGMRDTLDRILLGAEGKSPELRQILQMEANTTWLSQAVHGAECDWVFTPGVNEGRRLLYLHGGGMIAGSAKTHRALASRIASRTGMAVLVPNYRLAPEHGYPAALEDCVALFNWMSTHSPSGPSRADDVFLAGDSAGGGLVLSVLTSCQDRLTKTPRAAATFSALTDFTASGSSVDVNQETDVLLSRAAIVGLGALYGGALDLNHPGISPLYGEITGLPPLHMQVSASEVLLDDTLRFFEKFRASGGHGELRVYPGMVHGWQAFAPYLPESEQSLDELALFFAQFA